MGENDQLPPEPDMAGDARGDSPSSMAAQVSASRDLAFREFSSHDPATCWWCLHSLKLTDCTLGIPTPSPISKAAA